MDSCDQSHILPFFLFLFPLRSALMSHKTGKFLHELRDSVDISFFQVQSYTAVLGRTLHDAIQKNMAARSGGLWERCHLKCKE
jgi:hypothetical protein